ncbi:MFS transporter [Cellulomonas oligotrophica]|uniref:MFS family permease n=1 Tax=Cellulomonas oligotrophica TaxID=931536 RepID=A0A7Y9FFG9_9CELL|nr:MFS transporter [Cellulomonas oligotrophica]NYD86235.1 MFS family permease [Cellulomonas oligotrophica]GIG34438.1 hypothetical protein Col01nite_35970 [Cellulomonas oligotrophica]
MTVDPAPAQALPRPYLVWLAGSTVGRLGDAVLGFALGWAAAGLGGTAAALVLTLGTLPRAALLVVGGAVADRVGARRLLLVGETALLVTTAVLGLALARFGAPPWLLLTGSLALGTATALCLPATGSMPRRLVDDDRLPRALALRQGVSQCVLMAAAPVGGVLVGATGLPAVAWGAAAALGVSVGALVAIRGTPGVGARSAPGARHDVLGGFRVVAGDPVLRAALLLTGAGAALLLPVPSLLVPLLGRAAGWGPGASGAVAGAVGVGVVGAALVAARRRSGLASAATGLTVSTAGALALAAAPALGGTGSGGAVVAVGGGLVLGVGNGVLVTRLAPVVLGSAPRTHLARVQAVVGLAQVLPVLVTTVALGALAERTSPDWALATTAAGLAVCAAWARSRVPARA